ncbi:MAG: DNA repair protein RecO [Fimbriimonadaceae bacterium]
MAEVTVHAVVLRRRDMGESDRRLTLLTKERGVIDVTAKGARKGGSRLSGSSEPLSACILQLATGKRNQYVTQAQPISSFPGLRTDYDRLSYALALTELAAAVLPHEHPADEEFGFLVRALHDLEHHEKPLVALIWAQLKLMDMSGFLPSFDVCVLTGVPVGEALPFLSPHAGGYIAFDSAVGFTDRFQTRAEVLYGLSACQEIDEPPPNLKFASECFRALFPFWRAYAEKQLPANEAIAMQLTASPRPE